MGQGEPMILLLLGCLSMHKISTLSDYSSQQEKEKNAAKAIRVVQRSTLRPKTAETHIGRRVGA